MKASQKTTRGGLGVRGPALLAICNRADAALSTAYSTYQRDDFASAARCCLQASLRANKDGLSEWADEYGRKHAEANKKALGG